MSPEYVTFRFFSKKSDVYSFGVLILEIITKKGIQILMVHMVTGDIFNHHLD